MPAMWDRLNTASPSPIAVTPQKLPPPRMSSRAAPFYHNYQNSSESDDSGLKGLGIDTLSAGPNAYTFHIRGGGFPPSPDELSDEAPPVREPPPRHPNRISSRNSTWRPTSSIYSQPSPVTSNFANVAPPRYKYGSAAEEISPPSSPDIENPRHGRDVSPVDEVPAMSSQWDANNGRQAPPSQQKSNIPMMRRERRKYQDAAATNLRETKSKERLRERPGSRTETRPEGRPDGSTPSTGRQVFKLAQGKEMKWDAMTGEPTLLQTGRAGQVKAGEYAHDLSSNSTTSAIAMLRSAQQSFGDRVRRIRAGEGAPKATEEPVPADIPDAPPVVEAPKPTPTPAVAPRGSSIPQRSLDNRPEWKGASGRTTLVDPVRDTPGVAPLNIPRKSSKRGVRGAGGAAVISSPLSPISPSGSETSSKEVPTIRKIVPSSQQKPPESIPSPLASPATKPAQAYPSPPNSGSPIPPPHAPGTVSLNRQLESLSTPDSSDVNNSEKAIRRKPPPAASNNNNNHSAHHAAHPSVASSVYSVQEPTHHQTAAAPTIAEDTWTQPPSRFSVTTYATSTHTGSPRPSVDEEAPPMPTPPQHSILDRKRPKVGNGIDFGSLNNEPIVVSLKGAFMSSPYADRKANPPARNQIPPHMRTAARSNMASSIFSTDSWSSSIASTSKALPPAPPELSTANDRVAHLNARLESLANRRININKSIKQMTELMPTDSLIASDEVIRKRETEKLKVEGLKTELSEVQREEYELGLKLHRAYKRLDRDAEYEPTTLWVRRVTG